VNFRIKTHIRGIKKQAAVPTVRAIKSGSGASNTMSIQSVDDLERQEEIAQDYYVWGHDDPEQFLADIKQDYPINIRESKKQSF